MGKFESHGASSKHSQVAPRTSNCIGLISNTAREVMEQESGTVQCMLTSLRG